MKKASFAYLPANGAFIFSLLSPSSYYLADILRMDTRGEISIKLLGNIAETLRIERRMIEYLALIYLGSLLVIRRSVGGELRVQAQCLGLVAIATAVRPHVIKYVLMVLIKSHYREILGFLHELMGVTTFCHKIGRA